MTTTTLQKKRQLSYRANFMKAVVPLLTLIATLVSWQANAQNTYFYDDAITITRQPVGASSSIDGYRGAYTDGDTPYDSYADLGNTSTNTSNPDLGTYDYTSSALSISSGSILAYMPPPPPRAPTVTITGAEVQYRVYLKSTTTALPAYITIPLSKASTSDGGEQLYQNNAVTGANLLNGLNVSGRYVLEVVFRTLTRNSRGVTGVDADPSGSSYQAEFDYNAPPAPTLKGTAVYITPYSATNNAQPRITYTINSTATPAFQGANLGNMTYDLNTGVLLLNGGAAVTTEAGTRTVTSVSMYYRVRRQGQGGGSYTAINLTQNGNVSNDGTRNFSLTSRTINLVSSATIAGTYDVDIYFEAGVTDNANPNAPVASTLSDRTGANPYTASFDVTGTAIQSTVWVGGLNDNWFDDGNWTNNVPTAGTNVVINNLGLNSPNPYPRILCDTKYTFFNPSTQTTSLVDNTGKLEAVARNLSMAGNSQADRSILSLVKGTLKVNGDFENNYASFRGSAGTTISFDGTNQSISGGDFPNVYIAGGGVKTSQGVMNVTGDITFSNGLLVTDITRPTTSVVNLSDRGAETGFEGGRLMNENENSYLQGFVTISHEETFGTTKDGVVIKEDLFGNIGLGLTFYSNPGKISVTRNTAQAYTPGNGAASGVRRIFEVTQSNANAAGSIKADMRFFYLDRETKNLGPANNINIDENNLIIFASVNEGNTFINLGGTPNANTNIVTLTGTTSFAVPTTRFTLGDKTNPLPVELVAFDAKRSGNNALITWQTATEKNSAGFDVEVANDGIKFRKLAFVASKSANSTTSSNYSYSDIEAGKAGVRYYRLRQVDLDGKYAYSPIRAVSFAGAIDAAVASLSSYPSPFTSSDHAALVLQAPTAGTAQLQLTDLTGRTIASRAVTTVAGISEVAIPNASELAGGTYLVKVTFATGEVKTIRIQKR